MSSHMPGPSPSSNYLTPAPYGRACSACVRAKCKCFFQSGGLTCERCHRLGKPCEPSTAVRKRKAQTQPSPPPPPPSQPSSVSSRLEERLDDLVNILRHQADERQSQSHHSSVQSSSKGSYSPFTPSAPMTVDQPLSTPAKNPDLVIETHPGVVHLLRPADTSSASSPILADVAAHEISDNIAEERLQFFRHTFIPQFPFVNIPETTSAHELRFQKPFLWLNIMALSTKMISQQFAMEEAVWRIISQRIIIEHLADLDLLLGVICFASWSHYFKQDKPFMTMLSQLAVQMALELSLHKDAQSSTARKKPRPLGEESATRLQSPTIEERRTIIALFHLTSSTWVTYRKTEPLRWTPYMDACIDVLCEKADTIHDFTLVTQVRCQLITNQLTCPQLYEVSDEELSETPSRMVAIALLGKLYDIKQNLSTAVKAEGGVQFYLCSAELTVRESLLNAPRTGTQKDAVDLRRLQDFESLLKDVERWLSLFFDMPLTKMPGISVDIFSQFMHAIVLLFRLNTLDDPNWNLEDVLSRMNVLTVLDRACDMIDRVPEASGMVDASGKRSGLFFKTPVLFRAIKALFLKEMRSGSGTENMTSPTGVVGNDEGSASTDPDLDDFFTNLENEPWLWDVLGPSWNG